MPTKDFVKGSVWPGTQTIKLGMIVEGMDMEMYFGEADDAPAVTSSTVKTIEERED